ncbi:LOW QUALITY PROTEIN: Peptidase family C78 [Geosmithia morbida]|uniref:Peptidase family C78 n=1 Tax=Geosmithia morbida TaxID=1094350 RepID=A0A9P4YR27_9HYPO|nr:LOW QUALITY PROTEIN: Peptidase family C78 [Geosmithia morbida]KAF4120133.1 LOW QUALITY PROTEIN: Peptidase family C78 [Geosmithia morbida]
MAHIAAKVKCFALGFMARMLTLSEGIIPVMKRLLEKCPMTQKAYLCSQHVQHISKLRREGLFQKLYCRSLADSARIQGSFCGYRNIQMLISYIVNAKSEGANKFGDTFPSIFTIQDMIENAWDNGFNPEGRIETGGIRGTRKYIGTPEAFREKEAGRSGRMLFGAIESYFKGGVGNEVANQKSKVSLTTLPPIYLQHQGHSMTIVGFEKMSNGKDTLLVFDPSFRDTPAARELVGHTVRCPDHKAESILQQYRRDSKYVRKYSEFEVL